jgi:chorismate mutase/prephenate dehydratase
MASADPTSAAIASVRSARQYDLPVLYPDIQDITTNQTRFLILGGQDDWHIENAKTSLILSVANEPGALYKALEPFYRHNVSMCRLESRPSRLSVWEYNFYIDIVGHRKDRPVAAALEELGNIAAVRVLGSYAASASQ